MAVERQLFERGFTLLELLLYVAIIGSLLTAMVTFFGLSAETRVKNQTITEVNDQGMALMDYITQTVHNATAITTPAAGSSGASLSLTVPTGSLSPTVFDMGETGGTPFGGNSVGSLSDPNDTNVMNGNIFTSSATGPVSILHAYVNTPIDSAHPAQMAIYDANGVNPVLMASSSSVTVTAGWNSFPISTVTLTSGRQYMLEYNTSATGGSNRLVYQSIAGYAPSTQPQSFGVWPTVWTTAPGGQKYYSLYAMVGSTLNAEVKEGAAAGVTLQNSRVQVSNLTFQNQSNAGPIGIVRISFTMAANNSTGRTEYSYQRTFTGSAEVSW